MTLVVRLNDLPKHRRDWLLRYHADKLDHDKVDDLVAAAERRPCHWQYYDPEMTSLIAVRGNDRLYHLVAGDRVVCADVKPSGRRRKLFAGEHPHENSYIEGFTLRQEYWGVRLTATTVPTYLVPPAQRCPTHQARKHWPAHHNPDTRLGRQHAQLAAELGVLCHGCHGIPAWAIDHDHFTGLARGLLCRHCNNRIDGCPHLSGCPWADYLNNPPAAALRLRYCQAGRRQPLPVVVDSNRPVIRPIQVTGLDDTLTLHHTVGEALRARNP